MDRARRHQAILVGLKSKVMTPNVIRKIPNLLSVVAEHVKTDLDIKSLIRLARRGMQIDETQLHGIVLRPPIVNSFRTRDGKMVVALDKTEWRKALNGIFDAPLPGSRLRKTCPKLNAALMWKPPASGKPNLPPDKPSPSAPIEPNPYH